MSDQAPASADLPPKKKRKANYALGLGPALAFSSAVSYFLFFAQFPALRDVPWLNLPLVFAGLVLSLIALLRAFLQPEVYRGRMMGTVGAVVSLAITALFCSYIFSISYQLPRPSDTALHLEAAPDVSLLDTAGEPVRLAHYRGTNVVLTFYRGFW